MRFTHRIIVAAAILMAVVVSPGPTFARGYNTTNTFTPALHSYSGAWPVTVSDSQRSNGTGCLTLSGASSGSASLVFEGVKYSYGSFLVVNDILVTTIVEPLYGQNGALMFIVPAKRGHIGAGVYENIEGGSNFDTGKLAFGTKGGC